MPAQSLRRTDAAKLRQTISHLLDCLYALELSMDRFYRKGDRADLGRASDNFNEMLGYVDGLEDMIGEGRRAQHARADPADAKAA